MTKRQKRSNLTALALGAAMTFGVCWLYAAGSLERLEYWTLDLRFQFANPVVADSRIAMIDIGDGDLDVVGRWPWSRDDQAALIAVPAELGAAAILVDITYSEKETFGFRYSPEVDLTDPLSYPSDGFDITYPDFELQRAIRAAGDVYLAFHYPSWDIERSDDFRELISLLERQEHANAQTLADKIAARAARLAPAEAATSRPLDRARLVLHIERHPDDSEDEIAAALAWTAPIDRSFLEKALPHCQQAALRRLALRWLDENPQRAKLAPQTMLIELHRSLSGASIGNQSALLDGLASALRETLSDRATRSALQFKARDVAPAAPVVDAIDPVYYQHALAARRCGFANFEPDADGVVRRMQLFARQGGDAFAQLAFALAVDALGAPTDQAVASQGELQIATVPGAAPLRIQLDESGRAVLPWLPERKWERQFGDHIPADALWSVGRYRRLLEHNRAAARAQMKTILAADELGDISASYAQTVTGLEKLEHDIRVASYQGRAGDIELLGPLRDQTEESLRQLSEEAVARIAAAQREAGPDQRGAFDALSKRVEEWRRFAPANQQIQRLINETLARLRPRVAGKICLIGYTATSVADMKPIPTNKSAPGVLAHANLLNGLLTGRTVSWTSPVVNQVLTVVLGMLASLLSLHRRPRIGLTLVGGLLLIFLLLAGYWAFRQWLLWIVISAPALSILASHFSIAAYRYIFVDSERRQLSTALGQYTSKEIARQVAENPELCQRAESREVTAMFTDLRGFTTISERIGAERTQRVLNVCLGRFTDVMLRHEGMVNKFIGDGIFAFWNPVIYPQPDHARRACETSLDLLDALVALKREERARGGDDTFENLFLRVGVATGNAVVGPCGSEQKYDYTCIGDSVNVAARLESANKFFGTAALIGELTHSQTRAWFDFRPLGGVQVKGKTRATQVYELLARRGESTPDDRAYAEKFAAALALFAARDWARARAAFEALAHERPADHAAVNYLEETVRLEASPPGDDWSGAIELREK